jgi:hypothetical protein
MYTNTNHSFACIFFLIESRQDPNNRMACSLLQLSEMFSPTVIGDDLPRPSDFLALTE